MKKLTAEQEDHLLEEAREKDMEAKIKMVLKVAFELIEERGARK